MKRYCPKHDFRCYMCGKFISYADLEIAIRWTPFGSSLDEEPPDEEYAHKGCWDKASARTKDTIKTLAWIPVSGEDKNKRI